MMVASFSYFSLSAFTLSGNMADLVKLKSRTRSDYGYFLEYRTRWNDNDVYGHVNNSVYNFLVDSIVNDYLMSAVEPDKPHSERQQRGLVVHTQTNYFGSLAYPCVAELGLRVNHMSNSSARYEIGIFVPESSTVKAVGELTHVYVDRETGRPAAGGMGEPLKIALKALLLPNPSAPSSKL
ncbi:thioesterase superfamily protein-like protein [Plectosphaerella cucumerina]|uniref:Thioesterase superfamily protein-like protein n=1 Tax=Plectosphaerella cucumerina TaxID=40658 RepID=A0A8K0TD98_9PEZI|nr:thioesterase superfamily protein-like protein [Plectosphaerella cucumerina]